MMFVVKFKNPENGRNKPFFTVIPIPNFHINFLYVRNTLLRYLHIPTYRIRQIEILNVWILIRIRLHSEVNVLIRIRIETSADPKHFYGTFIVDNYLLHFVPPSQISQASLSVLEGRFMVICVTKNVSLVYFRWLFKKSKKSFLLNQLPVLRCGHLVLRKFCLIFRALQAKLLTFKFVQLN